MKSISVIFCIILASTVSANKISDADNRVTSDFYREIIKSESGNILFSPLSAVAVLAFLRSGTEGESAQELSKALYLPESKEEVQNETRSLLTDLQSDGATTFKIANAAFIKQNAVLKEPFLKAAKDDFYAYSQNVDFSKNIEAADVINKYVEDHTNNLIKNLISPDSLSRSTFLILVNALYFKGNWSQQFPQSNTRKDAFYAPNNEVIQVDTLHHYKKHFNYYACPVLKAELLELPFKGGEASMVIVLPKKRNGLPDVEKRIVDITTREFPFQSTYLNVALPKFKFDYRIDFKKVLSQLGVKKIFNSEADLSGIAGNKGDLVVSEVVQKAFMDLNEGGVEAAAATYVGVQLTSSVGPTLQPKNFVVDHPFIFLMKNNNTIIFAGRIVKPTY